MCLPQTLIIFSMLACMLVTLAGCVVKDSPAPGCIKRIGFPAMGGCFGKTAIIELKVEPVLDCVQIEANNCNGGVIDVRNNCAETVRLGGYEIPPSDTAILDVIETGGVIEVVGTSSNFSQYKPDSDKKIEIEGAAGDRSFRLTFTKTAPLCE